MKNINAVQRAGQPLSPRQRAYLRKASAGMMAQRRERLARGGFAPVPADDKALINAVHCSHIDWGTHYNFINICRKLGICAEITYHRQAVAWVVFRYRRQFEVLLQEDLIDQALCLEKDGELFLLEPSVERRSREIRFDQEEFPF